MADNFVTNAGSGGDTFAADEITGVKHQRVKVQHGADGSATDVSAASPLPVTDAAGATETTLAALNTKVTAVDTGAVVVSSSALPTGAATAANQLPDGHNVTVDNGAGVAAVNIQDGGNSITVDGPLTDTQLRASAVPVSAASLPLPSGAATAANQLPDGHNVTIDNGAGASAVNIQDGGNSITVDGTVAVSGTVTVGSHAVTNAGTFAVQESGAALTALQLIDDAVKTDDAAFTPATDKVLMVGAEFDDTTPDSVNEGDAGAVRMSANRNLYTTIRDAAGNERGVNVTAGNALTVDASATTQPVSAASLPLPIGASTETTVEATRVAAVAIRTFTDDVRTSIAGDSVRCDIVAGSIAVSSVTPGVGATNLGKAEDAAHTSGQTGVAILGVRRDTPIVGSDTDGDYSTINLDSSGRVYTTAKNEANSGVDIGDVTINNAAGASAVNIQDGGNSITVDGPLTDTQLRASAVPVSLASVPSHAVTNAGTFAVQDSEKIADDAAFTVATTKVQPVGLLADETSPDSVNEGDVGAPRMTLDRMAIVTVRPNATGEGLDIFRSIDVDETEEEIKATAGKLYGWFLYNAASAVRFIKFYNATAASVVVGTTTPILTIPLAAGAAANVEFTNGIPFSTALCIAATTGVADSDTGAPGANEIIANIFYK